MDFILSQVHEHERIAILTSGKKVQSFLTKTLIERSCNAVMSIDPSRWCSLEEIQSMIENVSIWERKMSIFMGKLLFWLEETRA